MESGDPDARESEHPAGYALLRTTPHGGVDDRYPMRYSGGLLGGSWLASLTGDLGNGKFEGVHLVSNFEQFDPAHSL